MRNLKVARRYAQALFELVEGDRQQIGERLRHFARLLSDCRELRHVLSSPAFRAEEKRQVIKKVTAFLGWGRPLDGFLEVLVENRRLDLMDDIAGVFVELADQAEGRLRAKVESAAELGQAELEALKQALEKATGRPLAIEAKTEPQLIAGLRMQLGELTLDGSLRSKLDNLRERLLRSRV